MHTNSLSEFLKNGLAKIVVSVVFVFSIPLNAVSVRAASPEKNFVDYVNPLMDTLSCLPTANTYPVIARPWGMNFWTPQTMDMGNGCTDVHDDYRICGFKQTHQSSPRVNDYGQFSIMPVVGMKIAQTDRSSRISQKSETATPYYYSVYLADHDIVAELSPTERAVSFRFTFPESDESGFVVDAFDNGSYIRVIPEENKIIGYSTKNSGGIADNFRNYFVIRYDKDADFVKIWANGEVCDCDKRKDHHVSAIITFGTRRGEQIQIEAASSFISIEQAERNLLEVSSRPFDEIEAEGWEIWNSTLGVFDMDAEPGQMRTFYSCLYYSLLLPRKFYEYGEDGKPIYYSLSSGKILPGYMFADSNER